MRSSSRHRRIVGVAHKFAVVLALLLIPEVVVAQQCPLSVPLTLKDTQGGFAGQTGMVWTIAPDCSFTVARQYGLKIAKPHRRGHLTGEQQAHLGKLLSQVEAAPLPERPGGPPQVNARTITLAIGGKVMVMNLAPGVGDLGAQRTAATGKAEARMLDLAAAIKDMTGG